MEDWRKELIENPTPLLSKLDEKQRLEIINELICHPSESKSGFEGFSHTEESRRAISLTQKERGNRPPPISEETRLKIILTNTGNTYSLGKKRSKLSKEKMRIAKIGKSLTEDHRNKISKGNLGKKLSDKTKEKMSQSKKGHVVTEETREKISLSKSGVAISNDHKSKISESTKGKKKPTMTCIHCGKTGGLPQIKRWHMDNCKDKK